MACPASVALRRWLGPRRDTLRALAAAHAAARAPDRRVLAQAYALRVAVEFQGFVRDLHDLTADRTAALLGLQGATFELVVGLATVGRHVDRANADPRGIARDFARFGMAPPRASAADRRGYQALLELRNALAHGNERALDALRASGVADTLTWAGRRLPGLDRYARALDRSVWKHLRDTFGADPWR